MEANVLAERVCQGDLSAFQGLVDQFKKKVYFLAYDVVGDHHEAEDVSQEVFIKVYRSLGSFRRDAKMSSWIYQITVNSAIDLLRKRKAKPSVTLENFDHIELRDAPRGTATAAVDPESSAEAALLQGRIEEALHVLAPRERAVFTMRHYNDFQINEIADVLEVSSGTVKSLLFRALQKLRRELAFYRGSGSWEINHE
ncbi:MAG: RNA polymerase sigma factor [Candidatus Aminicenantaceae bacterium]